MGKLVSFDDHKARKFVEQALLSFYNDPPDSDHQCGYMGAMAALYAEGLQGSTSDDRIATVLEWAGFPARLAQQDGDSLE